MDREIELEREGYAEASEYKYGMPKKAGEMFALSLCPYEGQDAYHWNIGFLQSWNYRPPRREAA